MTWGTITSVDAVPLAADLTAAANLGDLTLQVSDSADFYQANGFVSLNGVVYALVSIDDTTDILTIGSVVTVTGDIGDQVLVWDNAINAGAVSLEASVVPNGDDANGDPVSVVVKRATFPSLPAGQRDLSAGIGETCLIEEDQHGTWWLVNIQGRANATSGQPRQVTDTITVTVPANYFANVNISLATAFTILSWTVDQAIHLRIYPTAASRSADAGRFLGTDPIDGLGVILDYNATSGGVYLLSPVVHGASMEVTPSSLISARLDNLSGSPVTVNFSFVFQPTE